MRYEILWRCEDAAAETGIKQNTLSNCLRGLTKTSGGYHREYADNKGFEYGDWKRGVS